MGSNDCADCIWATRTTVLFIKPRQAHHFSYEVQHADFLPVTRNADESSFRFLRGKI